MLGISYGKLDWLSCDDQTLARKVFIDGIWKSKLSDLAEYNSLSNMNEYFEKLAEDYNTDAKSYREKGAAYEVVLMEEKGHQFRALLADEFKKMAQEVREKFPAEAAASIGKDPSLKKPDPTALASIQIRAAIHAAYFVETLDRPFKANDLIDALHAAVAVPYCDFFLTERGLAHVLTVKPRQFDQVYGTKITSNAKQFMAWLSEI